MENGSPPVLPPGMGGEHAYDAEKVSIGAAFFLSVSGFRPVPPYLALLQISRVVKNAAYGLVA